VDANGVCQGIQKVRVEPATRSVLPLDTTESNSSEYNLYQWLGG